VAKRCVGATGRFQILVYQAKISFPEQHGEAAALNRPCAQPDIDSIVIEA
jgi:hypothetical protein